MMPQITSTAIAALLETTATAIRKFGVAARNRCPWVSYINQAGKACSHFIARAKFSGYHFKFNSGAAVVTNLETGKQYSVSLTSQLCSCPAFHFAPFPKAACKHMKMVAELRGDVIGAVNELPQYVGIDEQDLPKGCSLRRTEDYYLRREFYVEIYVMARSNGVLKPVKRCVGQLVEGASSVQAYRLRSGIQRSFTTTMDAVKYLVNSSDYSLKQVEDAQVVLDADTARETIFAF